MPPFRRWRALAPLLGLMAASAFVAGERVRTGAWISAAIDAAWTVLMIYVICFRDVRRSKGIPRMSLLSKAEIFAADDRITEDVHVPEWGGTVRLRGLSGAERDDFESSIDKVVKGKPVRDTRNFRARLVALSAINEDGSPLFAPNEVAALGRRSSVALNRLYDVCCRLSGFSDEDVADLEGNSDGGQSEPPTSTSPSPSASPSMNSSPAPAPAGSPSGWPTNGSAVPSGPSASTTSPR